jgi:hypothetical protein
MPLQLEETRYEDFAQRIEQARNLNHEESRNQLLREIYSALRPLREAMYRDIGKKAENMLRLADGEEDDRTAVIEVTSLEYIEDVAIYRTCLGDLRDLYEVLEHMRDMDLEKAHEALRRLDSSVRESVGEDIWDFFEGE